MFVIFLSFPVIAAVGSRDHPFGRRVNLMKLHSRAADEWGSFLVSESQFCGLS